MCPGVGQWSEACWVRARGFFNAFIVLIKRQLCLMYLFWLYPSFLPWTLMWLNCHEPQEKCQPRGPQKCQPWHCWSLSISFCSYLPLTFLLGRENKLLVSLSHQNLAFCSRQMNTVLTDRKWSRLFSAPIFRGDANILNTFYVNETTGLFYRVMSLPEKNLKSGLLEGAALLD